jgi:hypothetical protein
VLPRGPEKVSRAPEAAPPTGRVLRQGGTEGGVSLASQASHAHSVRRGDFEAGAEEETLRELHGADAQGAALVLVSQVLE